MNSQNQTPIIIAIVGLVVITLGVLFFRTDTVKQTVQTDRTVETVVPQNSDSSDSQLIDASEEVPDSFEDYSEE